MLVGLLLSLGLALARGQGVNFGGSSSGSSSNSPSRRQNSTSNRIFGIVPGLDFGEGTNGLLNGALAGAGLVGGAVLVNEAINNPCGRKKRQAPGNKIFFGGGGNTNCGNSGGSSGNFNNNCNCRCQSGLTFYSNGVTYGDCRTPDNTGRTWCYTTGYQGSSCGDLQSSSRYPNNPWSYNACHQQSCSNNNYNRDCNGRPSGDKYYGCGCNNGRKKRQTRFFDLRCAEASILGRKAPNQNK